MLNYLSTDITLPLFTAKGRENLCVRQNPNKIVLILIENKPQGRMLAGFPLPLHKQVAWLQRKGKSRVVCFRVQVENHVELTRELLTGVKVQYIPIAS